ncbi:MAG: DUF3488 and transglutaminase-like domain-containing protein [Propionibacteriaceae bacterium]|jgi:hypothetical protein|nr:DUF3488 and transglutaminase-like domain-containing protein [Propionibacteriaceae bacterium]
MAAFNSADRPDFAAPSQTGQAHAGQQQSTFAQPNSAPPNSAQPQSNLGQANRGQSQPARGRFDPDQTATATPARRGQAISDQTGSGTASRSRLTRTLTARRSVAAPRCVRLVALGDLAALALMLAAALAGFWPVFGGPAFIRPAAIGLIVGLVLAWLGARFRLPTGVLALGVVVFFGLFGTAAAFPGRAIAQFVPNVDCLRLLIEGSVGVWKPFITASTPLASFTGMGLVPFIIALIGATTAGSAAWRAVRPAWVLLPIGLTAIAVIALGTGLAWHPLVQALVMILVAWVWLVWRAEEQLGAGVGGHRGIDPGGSPGDAGRHQSLWLLVSVLLLAAALLASGVAWLAAPNLQRDVVRAHVDPPLDLRDLPSPLASFRSLVVAASEEDSPDPLFSIDDWDSTYRLRLAVMDDYDGLVYNIADTDNASYRRVGPALGAGDTVDGSLSLTVTVGAYDDVWVPGLAGVEQAVFSGDRADSLTDNLYYNGEAEALIDTAHLQGGDQLTLTVDPPSAQPDDSTAVAISDQDELPDVVPAAVGALASKWAGNDPSAFKRVSALIDALSTQGFFSHGLTDGLGIESLPGHSSARIASLLERPEMMVGDDEQYAVAAALMLRSLGMPARVVMGFYTDEQSDLAAGLWQVSAADVHAWVEVDFDGVGWYPFYPTPDEDQTPQAQVKQKEYQPLPQVLQPPPTISKTDDSAPQASLPDRDEPDPEAEIDWGLIITLTLAIGLPLLVIVGPIVAIVWLKRRRRSRRSDASDPDAAVIGGWQELIDVAADRGLVPPASATRAEISQSLSGQWQVDGLTDLSARADRAAYAADPADRSDAESYWADLRTSLGQLRQQSSVWQRLRATMSVASLRPRRRPTLPLAVGGEDKS